VRPGLTSTSSTENSAAGDGTAAGNSRERVSHGTTHSAPPTRRHATAVMVPNLRIKSREHRAERRELEQDRRGKDATARYGEGALRKRLQGRGHCDAKHREQR
jgi:hypothetical protein